MTWHRFLDDLTRDPASQAERLVTFLREYAAVSGIDCFVLGLSGGVDSALSAALGVRALGKERVHVVYLPYATSAATSRSDAQALCGAMGLPFRELAITPVADAAMTLLDCRAPLRMGNLMARTRMLVLYDRARELGGLVLGTGNRTEGLLGYTTLWGDMACDINPLGGLFKCQVRSLAKELGVPESILTKAPSADLWKDQTDEGEMGITYDEADAILHLHFDLGMAWEAISREGLDAEVVARVRRRFETSGHKRRMPLTPDREKE